MYFLVQPAQCWAKPQNAVQAEKSAAKLWKVGAAWPPRQPFWLAASAGPRPPVHQALCNSMYRMQKPSVQQGIAQQHALHAD